MPEKEFRALLNQFCIAVRDCREVYLNGAKVVIDEHSHLLDQPPTMFMEMMDELHRGLLLKLYIHICGFNQIFTAAEETMGQMLILHSWHQEVTTAQVRDSLGHFRRQAETLRWTSLVRPFKNIAPLRKFIPNLETCIMRIGNLMAKADGNVTMLEIEELKSIQAEILTFLKTESALPPSDDDPQSARIVFDDGQQIPQSFRKDSSVAALQAGRSEQAAKVVETAEVIEDLEIIEAEPAKFSKQRIDEENEEDLLSDEEVRQKKIDEAIEELQSLTGLTGIKEEVRSLSNLLKVQAMRRDKGLPETKVSLHMAFEGNPGTGKTTVARIVGRIFAALKVLNKGQVIETDRSGLVAEYAGQTGPKTNKVIDSALDGILFIDEAYSLIGEGSDGDAFGQEAIQTLLKRMEDDRDRLVVIMAGYPTEMDRLLKSNPGLSSRIGRRLTFEDYQPAELGAIFGSMCRQNHYRIVGTVQAKVIEGLNWSYQHRDRHFGNGRMVRNLFENAVRQLANRIADIPVITEDLLTCFEQDDICFETVPNDVIEPERVETARFKIACKHCQAGARVIAETLGRKVRCRKCGKRFVANWGSPVP